MVCHRAQSYTPPLLFNVYTADIVNTMSKRFINTDDADLGSQGTTLSEVEITLGENIAKLQKYFKTLP